MATSTQLRRWWAAYLCTPAKYERVAFPGVNRTWSLLVAAPSVPLWEMFVREMNRFDYKFRESAGGTYNCFTGETLVMTPNGERRLDELVGTDATLLTRRFGAAAGKGSWVEVPVKSYGEQEIWEVGLSRAGAHKTIRTTADHRWLIKHPSRRGQERFTRNLRIGDKLASVYPNSRKPFVSSVGVQHGLVYGDGTRTPFDARAYLIGETQSLLEYFGSPRVRVYDQTMHVYGLPRSWKSLPSLDEGPSYLYGFLAGWFAADGDVSKQGRLRLSCVDSDALEYARLIGLRLGITFTPVTTSKRRVVPPGATDPVDHVMHSIAVTAGVGSEFLLLDKHASRWRDTSKAPAKWKVESVQVTSDVETVYCAEVPGTEAFALADNILTGNCRRINHNPNNAWSNHAYGIALDLNPRANPYGQKTNDYPKGFISAVKRIDTKGKQAFRYGGDFRTPDPMHWDLNVAPADIESGADMAALQVEDLQEALNQAGQKGANGKTLTVDGIYGPNTKFALSNGLTAAGFTTTTVEVVKSIES